MKKNAHHIFKAPEAFAWDFNDESLNKPQPFVSGL